MAFDPSLVERVLAAQRSEDLFEDLAQWDADPLRAIDVAFKRFSWIHPDLCDDPRAEDAFKRLGELRKSAEDRVRRGVYGTKASDIRVTARRHTYIFGDVFAEGAATRVYRADRIRPGAAIDVAEDTLIKVPLDASSNARMANEARRIKEVLSHDPDAFDHVSPYLPTFVESFMIPGPGGRRRCNAFDTVPGMVPLTEVLRVYQRGVHPKDMAWMARRLFVALGHVHNAGVIHGAVLPEHVLIMPEQHGLVLCDWKHSSEVGGTLDPVLDMYAESWYPEVQHERRESVESVDIAMAARCMEYVCGGRDALPRQLRAFFKGCQSTRVPHAWDLFDEFTGLIERMWGPRKFRPFVLPRP